MSALRIAITKHPSFKLRIIPTFPENHPREKFSKYLMVVKADSFGIPQIDGLW